MPAAVISLPAEPPANWNKRPFVGKLRIFPVSAVPSASLPSKRMSSGVLSTAVSSWPKPDTGASEATHSGAVAAVLPSAAVDWPVASAVTVPLPSSNGQYAARPGSVPSRVSERFSASSPALSARFQTRTSSIVPWKKERLSGVELPTAPR